MVLVPTVTTTDTIKDMTKECLEAQAFRCVLDLPAMEVVIRRSLLLSRVNIQTHSHPTRPRSDLG